MVILHNLAGGHGLTPSERAEKMIFALYKFGTMIRLPSLKIVRIITGQFSTLQEYSKYAGKKGIDNQVTQLG